MKNDLILKLRGARKGQVMQLRDTGGNIKWRRAHEDELELAFCYTIWTSLCENEQEKIAWIRKEFSDLTLSDLKKVENWLKIPSN